MLKRLTITNFRSVEKQQVEFAPITLFYGATSSGKSSVLYSICTLRNFVLNPNQAPDGFFNYGFINLGGFEPCVFNHEKDRMIGIVIEAGSEEKKWAGYGVRLGKDKGEIKLDHPYTSLAVSVPLPYPLNLNSTTEIATTDGSYTVNWNGVAATVAAKEPTPNRQSSAQSMAKSINLLPELIKSVDIAPHRRGFFRSNYTPVPITPTPTSEDEVATLIINDPNLAPKISLDTDKIFHRDFRLFTPSGTATTFFQTTDKNARTPVFLVNDGFGVNQLVYLLAKIHRTDVKTLLIEEPEVHLHPTIVRGFARTLCQIAKEDGKQFIIATHSEQFVAAMLTCVSEGAYASDDLACYHVYKEKRTTLLEKQEVSKTGQLQGGLTSFVEGEMEDLKKLLEARR